MFLSLWRWGCKYTHPFTLWLEIETLSINTCSCSWLPSVSAPFWLSLCRIQVFKGIKQSMYPSLWQKEELPDKDSKVSIYKIDWNTRRAKKTRSKVNLMMWIKGTISLKVKMTKTIQNGREILNNFIAFKQIKWLIKIIDNHQMPVRSVDLWKLATTRIVQM